MDNELKQYLEGMEDRILNRIKGDMAAQEDRILARIKADMAAQEHRLTERMRDMQTELLRGFEAFSAGQVLRVRKVEADQFR